VGLVLSATFEGPPGSFVTRPHRIPGRVFKSCVILGVPSGSSTSTARTVRSRSASNYAAHRPRSERTFARGGDVPEAHPQDHAPVALDEAGEGGVVLPVRQSPAAVPDRNTGRPPGRRAN